MKAIIKQFTTLKYLTLVLLALFVVSCEEVIDIDLNSSAPKLVAEGYIEKDSLSYVRLTYTSDYFTTEAAVYINDAMVQISNEQGDSETLVFKGDGLYKGNSLIGTENTSYTMQIEGADFSHEAISKLFPPVQNLSLSFEKNINPHPSQSSDNYTSIIRFNEAPTTETYYLIKFWVNGVLNTDRYHCIKDTYYADGDIIEYAPFFMSFEQDDEVVVYVYSIDEDAYTYFNQLNDLSGSGMNSSTPYNPQSNFGNEVLGYFISTSYNSVQSIVQE